VTTTWATDATDAPAEGIRLRLQGLAGPVQVLSVGALAALSAEDGFFTTRNVADLMSELRLPPIRNVSATLGRLREQKLVMQPNRNFWALTPMGEARLETAAAGVSAQLLASDLGQDPGSDFGERHHTLIPPFLAPTGSAAGLSRILAVAPFEKNVMLVTRFPKSPDDRFASLISELRDAVAKHGLVLQVASDRIAEDTLWSNVVTHMWASKYAIVLMDSLDGAPNPNVLIEIGGMLMTGRRCAILRDKSVPRMPTDLVGHIYKPTDLDDHVASIRLVHQWIRDDLGLGACADCR
jgi:hypothetical protein